MDCIKYSFALIQINPFYHNSSTGMAEASKIPCLEVSTIIFRSRPTPKTLLKAWK